MIEWLSFDVVAHLWQSTLVIGVVWLMTLALRGNRAHVRHRLWLAASVKFLVPFSWLVSLGAQLEWSTAPSIAQPAATFVMEEILAPPVIATVASTPAAHTTSAWPWTLASIWVVGVAGVLFWWWRQWRLVRAALRQAKPIALGSAYDVAGLTLMSSPWTFEPGMVGIWRPVLLLPEGLVDRLTPAQLNTVIAHERCHIERHDNLGAAVHMLVEAIFWFHPLVWWIERRMIAERERACDEAVLGAGNDPDEYVAGILTVCRFTLRAPLACVAGVSGAELRTRIESIVRMELGAQMTLTRRVAVAVVAAVLLGAPIIAGLVRTPVVVAAQGPKSQQNNSGQTAATLRFDVASIKRNKGDGQTVLVRAPRFLPGGSFEAVNVTLGSLIRLAYGLQDFQIVGGPKWVDSDRFDIQARGPQGATESEGPRRLQSLLAERFALTVHKETRDHPVYALVLARADKSLGPRLRRSQIDPKKLQEQDANLLRENPATFKALECGLATGRRLGDCGSTMATLATRFPIYVGRMVVDRTGLTGLYQYDLRFGDRPIPGAGPGGGFPASISQPADPDAPSLFTALEEQLGLKLVPQTGRVEVLVLDHAEPPKPN
jgi:bla regulator protein blaR1